MNRICYYIEGRLSEWTMVLSMFLLAIEIFLWPGTALAGSMQNLSRILGADNVGLFFLVVAVARGAALIANGRSHVYGPRVRAFGALAGAVIWAEMDVALLMNSVENQIASPGIPIFFSLTVCEMISSYRAATDVRKRSV